jgi:hypothetical protein
MMRRVAEEAYRSAERPLHAERIRRPWEALEGAMMSPVVEVGVIRLADSSGAQKARIDWVEAQAGSGSRGCR